ncbi:MAG TPA: hypothetical protein DDW87_12920, partial [Firmicutes bacterium]|nr:hypothetical protein [Bacillota bacterium]
YVLAEPLSQMLFGYSQVGAPLSILAAGTVTLGLIQTSTGILQGLGAMHLPVISLAIGVVVKFALNYVLLAHPQLGMLGAAWSTSLTWMIVAALNLAAVFGKVGKAISLRHSLLYPSVAAGGVALLMYFLQDTLAYYIKGGLGSLLALVIGLVLYFLLTMIWGSFTLRDVHLIPGAGKPLGRWLQAWGFLPK